ncbi:MAG TPA: cupin domain-containing protein [Acidimicrobiales bacterium]|nr:cupin domain-containing protein [Acidimicrobiales bacterium]
MDPLFPPFVDALPRPDSPFAIDARIVPSEHALTMFYTVPEETEIPEHAHGPQWGVVLAGSMEMVIGGVARTYRSGEYYLVEEGVPHVTRIHAGYSGIDVFADAHRYEPKPDGTAPGERIGGGLGSGGDAR